MRPDRGSKRRVLIGIIISVLLIACFGAGVYLFEKHGLLDEQFGDSGDWGKKSEEKTYLKFGSKLYHTSDSVDSYLLVGLDDGGVDKGAGFNGTLADFLMLLVIDNTTEKYTLIQIDRNTMVDVQVLDENGEPTGTFNEQITLAHWYGQNEEQRNRNTKDAVSKLLGGMKINGAYFLNMKDIGTVNDAIGGVTVDIESDMTNVDPAFVKGESVHLTGDLAQKFLRARTGVDTGTNKERMSRQRQYLQKVYNLMMNQIRENPEYINDLYAELENVIESDSEDSRPGAVTNQLVNYESQGIQTFVGKVEINDTLGDGEEHEEFYADRDSIISVLSKVIDLKEYTEEDAERDAREAEKAAEAEEE